MNNKQFKQKVMQEVLKLPAVEQLDLLVWLIRYYSVSTAMMIGVMSQFAGVADALQSMDAEDAINSLSLIVDKVNAKEEQ